MKYMRTDLHDQGFRSKASSASRPSPINLAFPNMEVFIFCVVNIVTQSPEDRGFLFVGKVKR